MQDCKVSCILKGDNKISEVAFSSLSKGDKVFSGGDEIVVDVEAHYSGDASYDGYLFYDKEGNGWFPEDLDTGLKPYAVAVAVGSEFYIPEAEHIERVDALGLVDSDEEAARLAENEDIHLIYDMPHVAPGVYVDTPENRAVIQKGLQKYPEYKDVGCKFIFAPTDYEQAAKALQASGSDSLSWTNDGYACLVSKYPTCGVFYDLHLTANPGTTVMIGESVTVLATHPDTVDLFIENDEHPYVTISKSFFESNFSAHIPQKTKMSLKNQIKSASSIAPHHGKNVQSKKQTKEHDR